MWLLGFYRFYVALALGGLSYFLLLRSVWLWLGVSSLVRIVWAAVELILANLILQRDFRCHIGEFRQMYGPYGIRLANKAENDRRIRVSLAEVFTENPSRLKKAVDTLEVMDAMFRSGMRPEGDEYLLHDLKLKYGKYRQQKKQG
jgi:hypothetical protein